MPFKPTLAALLLAVLLGLSSAAANADEAAITRAWQLVDAQQYQSAYDLLAPLEAEHAGEPVYDYLLGIAALRSGKPALALFPLERVLIVQPDHPEARLAFAQAYLAVGDLDSARREFDIAVQRGSVDAGDAEQFRREYDRKTIGVTQIGASIDLALGYDDNVTSATSETRFVTPDVVVTLDDDVTDIEDGFVRARGSAWLQKPLTPKYRLLAAGSLLGRVNESADEQDYTSIDARIGMGNRDRKNQLAAYLFGTSLERDSESYQTSLGLLAQWRHQLDPNAYLVSYLRSAQLEYDDQDDRDSLYTLLSVTYVRRLASEWSPSFYTGISGGDNAADSSSGDEFGYSLVGLNAGVELNLSARLRPYAHVYYSEREFDADSSIFDKTREDERLTLRFGVEIGQVSNWTIKPELVYIDNDSNLPVNEYDRTMAIVSFQRDFN